MHQPSLHRAVVALALLGLAGIASAQSVPALEIGRPYEDDPSRTVIKPDSVPAIPIDRSTTVRRGSAREARPYDDYHSGRAQPYQREFACESVGNRLHRCPAPPGQIRLIKRYSRSACEYGRDWGQDRNSVWVSNGCRAGFRAD